MSGIPDHKFSIKKGRQLSPFEAGVDSIRRRISTSIGGSRRSGQEKEARLSALLVSRRRWHYCGDKEKETI
jgi:hypothetical protein